MTLRRTHWLKTWPASWHAVKDGTKTAEVRFDDRDFRVGDLVRLLLYHPCGGTSGHFADARGCPSDMHKATSLTREITHVLYGGRFGIEPGFVVLSLAKVEGTADPA